MNYKFTVFIQKEEDWYVSKCLENNIASQGKTIEEAITNLREAIELFYEDETPETVYQQTLITTMEVVI